jgi:hypothetical protein
MVWRCCYEVEFDGFTHGTPLLCPCPEGQDYQTFTTAVEYVLTRQCQYCDDFEWTLSARFSQWLCCGATIGVNPAEITLGPAHCDGFTIVSDDACFGLFSDPSTITVADECCLSPIDLDFTIGGIGIMTSNIYYESEYQFAGSGTCAFGTTSYTLTVTE